MTSLHGIQPSESVTEPTPSDSADVRRPRGIRSRVRVFGRYPRLMGVDVARGLAVLGMLAAHVGLGTAGFDWAAPQTWDDLVNGRSAILFAVIAGVSVALMTRGLDRDDADAVRIARLRLVGRGLAVFVIGIALELLGTPIAVILPVYGVLFMVAGPLLTWRARSLVIGAAVSAVAVPAVLAAVGIVSAVGSGQGVSFALTGIYPIPVWITFLLAGLAVGRMPLHRVRVQLALLAAGAVLATVGYGAAALARPFTEAAAGGASTSAVEPGSGSSVPAPADTFDFTGLECQSAGGYITCATPEKFAAMEGPGQAGGDYWAGIWASDPPRTIAAHWLDSSAHSGGALEIIGSGGLALAVLALALLVARPLRWVLIPLAALGSMPLSAYTAHVLLIASGWLPSTDPLLSWTIGAVCLLVLTTTWALVFGRGPLERVTTRVGAVFAREDRRRSS